MKTVAWALALALLPGGALWAQEEEKPLTPEEAIEMLKEIYALMGEAEARLNDAARTEGLAAEKDVAEKIEELLKQMDQSAATQRAVIEKMNLLLERSKKKQESTVEKINELIRRAQKQQGQGQSQPQPQPNDQANPSQSDPAQGGGQQAQRPYNPNKNDEANKFRSKADRYGSWGNLPPKAREAMHQSKRAIEDFPPEFQELLKQYHKAISDEDQ
jgi:hypothetical protein